MNAVRRNITKLILLGIITVMCCSCGPTLKSMRDTDDYIKNKRIERLKLSAPGRGEGAVFITTPEVTMSSDAPGSILLLGLGLLTASMPMDYVAAAAYAPTTLIGIPEKVKNQPVTGKIMDIKSWVSTTIATLTRKEPGKQEWNLKNEAIKRVGDVPKRHDACRVNKFEMNPYSVTNVEYKGADGEISIEKGTFFPTLEIYAKRNVTPECTMEDLLIYKDYMLKFTAALAHILKEENAKLDEQILQEHPELKNLKMEDRDVIYWRNSDTKKRWKELPDGKMVPIE